MLAASAATTRKPARSPVHSTFAPSGPAAAVKHSGEAQTTEDLLWAWVAERAPGAMDPSQAQITQAMGAEMRRTIATLNDFVG